MYIRYSFHPETLLMVSRVIEKNVFFPLWISVNVKNNISYIYLPSFRYICIHCHHLLDPIIFAPNTYHIIFIYKYSPIYQSHLQKAIWSFCYCFLYTVAHEICDTLCTDYNCVEIKLNGFALFPQQSRPPPHRRPMSIFRRRA